MSDDIECPYCEHKNEHDGESYEENGNYQWQCRSCEKFFIMNPEHSIHFSTEKADCLNGGEHSFRQQICFPTEYTKMECWDCHETRDPAEAEWVTINARMEKKK